MHIGHNVSIGGSRLFCGKVGISGSVTIGDRVRIGGGVGIGDHMQVGDQAVIGAGSGVATDVPPRMPFSRARRRCRTSARWSNIIYMGRLSGFMKRWNAWHRVSTLWNETVKK